MGTQCPESPNGSVCMCVGLSVNRTKASIYFHIICHDSLCWQSFCHLKDCLMSAPNSDTNFSTWPRILRQAFTVTTSSISHLTLSLLFVLFKCSSMPALPSLSSFSAKRYPSYKNIQAMLGQWPITNEYTGMYKGPHKNKTEWTQQFLRNKKNFNNWWWPHGQKHAVEDFFKNILKKCKVLRQRCMQEGGSVTFIIQDFILQAFNWDATITTNTIKHLNYPLSPLSCRRGWYTWISMGRCTVVVKVLQSVPVYLWHRSTDFVSQSVQYR